MAESWYLQGGFTTFRDCPGPKPSAVGRGTRPDCRTTRGRDDGLETSG
jgi:hypothetical protein